jgi:hypothetical protein
METLENPDLHTSATWIVCLNQFALFLERAAYGFVRTALVSQYQPRARIVEHWIVGFWCNRRLDADCLPVLLGYSGSLFLCVESRQTLFFRGSI